MSKIKIMLVDDQHLFRKGLASLIRGVEEFELLSEEESAKAVLERLKLTESLPDVLLVDMNMPEMNGVELTAILHKKYPEIRIIILTVYDQERFINKMVQGGANGYLLKNCEVNELTTAIKTVCRTGFYFNEMTLQAIRNASKYKDAHVTNINNIPIELTKRETEVLQLICQEYTNGEIAEKMFLSPRTVEGHRNNLLAKIGCRNTAGLVLFAVTYGIYKADFLV
jgi:DNA-binding NarL/FixJ family response regulator